MTTHNSRVPSNGEHNEPLGAQVAEVLAAFDELFAVGEVDAAPVVGPATINGELHRTAVFWQMLQQVWPQKTNHSSDADLSHSPLPLSTGPKGNDVDLHASEGGRALGRFDILRELGRGGGGIVFLAVDTALGRAVALKLPVPEVLVRPELRERFVQEGQAAAKLSHPNIIPVYEAGEIGPICYIASAYCEGPTLSAWLESRKEPVPFFMAAELVAALADAVEHAHSNGVLHRDIKPSNVLLEERGAESDVQEADATPSSPLLAPCPSPKLTDFGLAKLLEVERDSTRTGAVLGTPTYMAPEQADGRLADIDVTTDVYGLGVILYELIAGRPPFQGQSDLETLHAITRDDPPPLRKFRARVPRDLEAICFKCLEKKSINRYLRAADLGADLHRFLDGRPTVARPVGWSGRTIRWARRRPAAAGLLAVSLLAAVAAIVGLSFHVDRVEQLKANANERIERQTQQETTRTKRNNYAANIQAAYHAWQSNDLKSAIELLDSSWPSTDQEDLRGFEWYFLRRLCSGGLVSLRGHEGPVFGTAFSPDGKQLASCGADGTLRFWDVNRGTIETTIPAHAGAANAVAWSADGRYLATAGDDAIVCIWDAETRQLQAKLPGGSGRLLSTAISPDGRHVAAAGDEGTIRVWDLPTRELLFAIPAHTETIHSITFSPDGDRIASGSDDGTARVWNMAAPAEPVAIFAPDSPVASVAFSPDGKTLVTADGQITLWDLSRRIATVQMNAHGDRIRSVTFSPDGKTIASAAQDTVVLTWDATPPDGEKIVTTLALNFRRVQNAYRGHTNAVLSVAFSPQGNRLASAGKDGTIQIWDPTKPHDRQPLHSGRGAYGLATSASGGTLAAALQGDSRSELTFWKSPPDEPVTSIPVEGKHISVNGLSFSSDGKSLACLLIEGTIDIFDRALGSSRSLTAPKEFLFVNCDFAPNDRHLAIAASNWNSARVLDVATGEVLSTVPGQRALAFSPDGRLLATESSDVREFYPVELWDLAAGKSAGRLVGHKGQIDCIEFSRDGQLVATGSADGTARLWNLDDRTELFTMRGHERGITRLAFLLEDKSLATAGVDGKVKIWQVATGQQLLSLDVTASGVSGLAVSADGRTLYTAGTNLDSTSRVDLWSAPAADDQRR